MVSEPFVIGTLFILNALFCICTGKWCIFFLPGLAVPRLSIVINHDLNQINLQPADSKKSLASVCIQYENNGRCEV